MHNDAFNVCRISENYRIRDLEQIVAETVPRARITFAEGAGADQRCYRVDGKKIISTLKAFRPQWTARMGAVQLLLAYRTYGITQAEFEGPKYKRIAHIRKLLAEGILDKALRFRRPAEPVSAETPRGERTAGARRDSSGPKPRPAEERSTR